MLSRKEETQYEMSQADMQLLQALMELFAVPQTIKEAEALAQECREKLDQIEEAQCSHENGICEIEALCLKLSGALDAFYQKQNCMEEASRQQTLLAQQHFDRHIVEPLARRILPLIDMLCEDRPQCGCSEGCDGRSEILDAIKAQLLDLLAGYGIEPIEVAEGSRFDAKIMKPVGFTSTHLSRMDSTVNVVVRPGFRREERVLRPAMVNLYRRENCQEVAL